MLAPAQKQAITPVHEPSSSGQLEEALSFATNNLLVVRCRSRRELWPNQTELNFWRYFRISGYTPTIRKSGRDCIQTLANAVHGNGSVL